MFSRVLGHVLRPPRIDSRKKTLRHQYTNVPPRKYPIGISDWKKIKKEEYFYFDKSMFLKEFYEDNGETVLILRPRRWAKTTTWSMAKYFFDINNQQLAKELFVGTQLEKENEFINRTCGQFPVISLSFHKCRATNWKEMRVLLCSVIADVYRDHIYLFKTHGALEENEQLEFDRILKKDEKADFQSALQNLTKWLHRYHKKRVIVLIDEYDVPVNEAHLKGYYDDAISFLSSTFTATLKDNPYLEKGLLTGVLRVAKAGYLTGLNNLNVYSMLDSEFADKYGVKQEELNKALDHEGLSDKTNDVKEYYNGYTTAIPSMFLYNPWSILKYLSKKKLDSYWIETGKTDFIATAMWSSPLSVRQNILPLLNGETIQVPFEVDINYKALDSPRALWSLLYFSGYLTGEKADEDYLKARIPNYEVKRELSVMWRRVIEEKHPSFQYSELISGLLSGNQQTCETHLRTLAWELFSTHDLARTPEAWYHAFMLSLLYPLSTQGYRIESNREAGLGRIDIILHPPVGKPAVIIEFKTHTDPKEKDKVESDDDLRPDAEKGLQQIIENDYTRALSATTKSVILCSIAFVRKFVAVSMKEHFSK